MKKLIFVLCAVLLLTCLVACSGTEDGVFSTGEDVLLPVDVAGTWKVDDSFFAYLILDAGENYVMKDASGKTVRNGTYMTEGDALVLDGFGVDDPDLYMQFTYDKDLNTLSGGLNGTSFLLTLTRAGSGAVTEEPDFSDWYGTFRGELGTVSIGKGAEEGTALMVITPVSGTSLSTSIVFDSEVTAESGLFTLALDSGNILILEGLEEESIALSGTYLKD